MYHLTSILVTFGPLPEYWNVSASIDFFCQTPSLVLVLGVDFGLPLPQQQQQHLNLLEGIVLKVLNLAHRLNLKYKDPSLVYIT